MAIDFPASPTNGQTFTSGSVTYTWDGVKWTAVAAGGGATDKITEGNTSAEVIDTGSDGRFVVTTEGTERLRVDANGRLAIGTAPYAWEASPTSQALQVRTGILLDYISAQVDVGRNFYYDGSGFKYGVASTAEKISFSSGEIRFLNAPSGSANAAQTMTERMRISQNGGTAVYTSADPGFRVNSSLAAGAGQGIFAGFHSASNTTNGTVSFVVYTNGDVVNTNNSYGAISDIKLKENIVDANSQWDDIKALRPVNYNFKPETGAESYKQLGLVAQEVEQVCPGLVSESPDRDEEGNDLGTVTKSVNYSVLYMKAVKALQEAMERIETLEAKVAALENPTV